MCGFNGWFLVWGVRVFVVLYYVDYVVIVVYFEMFGGGI